MKYVVDVKNNKEYIYASNFECEHCDNKMHVNGSCENKSCKFFFKGQQLIHSGNIGDWLLFCLDSSDIDINEQFNEYTEYIKKIAKKEENPYKFFYEWVSKNMYFFEKGTDKRHIYEFLYDFYFLAYADRYLIPGHWYQGSDELVRVYKYHVSVKSEDYVKLKYFLNKFVANDCIYKKGFFKLFYRSCFNFYKDFSFLAPSRDIEKQILSAEKIDFVVEDDDIFLKTSGFPVFDYLQLEYCGLVASALIDENQNSFNADDAFTVCLISLNFLLENGYKFYKCENCGKFFIPFFRSDTLYCDRVSPQDENKTCKEYGAYAKYLSKLKNNKVENTYRKIYQQKQMRAKRNPDIETYKEDFEKFKQLAKQWKTNVKKGIRTEKEFSEWLETQKRERG